MDLRDVLVSLGINVAIVAFCLALYSVFSIQPVNARIYFTSWFVINDKEASAKYEKGGALFCFSWRAYLHGLDWVFVALRKPDRDLLAHAGLDMLVYLRMLKLGVKIFLPVFLLSTAVLIPLYWTEGYLPTTNYKYGFLDECTISNIPPRSTLYWVPCVLAWMYNLWALWLLQLEYRKVAQMRLDYLGDQRRAPNEFTVLVRQVPPDNTRKVAEQTAQFFSVVHKDNYLMTTPVFNAQRLARLQANKKLLMETITALKIRMERNPGWVPRHKTGCCGLTGATVNSLDKFEEQLSEVKAEIKTERDRITANQSCILHANFVSFRSRWGAAVAAQTRQSKDSTKWITTWAPEPQDVAWESLPIPYLSRTARHYGAAGVVIAMVVLYIIPIGAVQGLTSLNSLTQKLPQFEDFLRLPFISSLITAFLPGCVLMFFMVILPPFLKILTSVEGYVSKSEIARAAAGKMFYFNVFSLFFSNLLIGSAWGRLFYYIENPASIPGALGASLTSSSSFFMAYTMLNGWTGVAAELTRLIPFVLFHLRNRLLARTERDRVKAMSSHGPYYTAAIPFAEFYFFLPFMYWVLAPLYLPFAIVAFSFAYVVYRNQFINVYTKQYDLAGGYWPDFHLRVVTCMILAQLLLICTFALKQVIAPTICLLPLPVLTVLIHVSFIAGAYKPTFSTFALEEALRKDTIDRVTNPAANPTEFLAGQYLHPSLKEAFKASDLEEGVSGGELMALTGDIREIESVGGGPLVPVKRHPRSRDPSPMPDSVLTLPMQRSEAGSSLS